MKSVVLEGNALEVASSRYLMESENWDSCAERVAFTMSVVEGSKRKKYQDEFHEMIGTMDFLPGGRILRNSGRVRGSLFNCYHLPIDDNIESIGQFLKESLVLWSEGGGIGSNFSKIRPKGDVILGKGGTSSGLVSFIEAADGVAGTIESGGARRAAGLVHVDVSHPEVMDFIDAKLVHGKISHFNISVAVNDDFLQAVETDSDWTFKFNQKKYHTVKARHIWDKIVDNMINSAEPGLINWTNFHKNNSWYYSPVLGTNPCGETCLGPHDVCDLGSLVLPNFITGNVNTNWKKLESTIKLAVRFLDNVIQCNKYVMKEIEASANNSRRIGIGVLGVAEYLFAKKVKYGSERSVLELERLMQFIRNKCYEASVELAAEKGSFPAFNPVLYGKSSFIRKLPASLRMDIKKYGIRNVTLQAIAPTGTVSLLTPYTGSAEPLFAKAYKRKDRVSERIYVHPMYEKMLKDGEEIPDWFVDTFDLKPQDHFNIQAVIQKYVDSSVSKTINLPSTTTKEDLSQLLLENIVSLKGVTVYRDGCRGEQPLNQITKEEAIEYIQQQNVKHSLETGDVQCSTGKCDI